VTRQNRGYLDRGRGRFDVSPSILARVFSAGGSFWRDSAVVVPAFGSTLAGVLPVAAVTGSLPATAAVMFGVYPFCHLFFRFRARHGAGSNQQQGRG